MGNVRARVQRCFVEELGWERCFYRRYIAGQYLLSFFYFVRGQLLSQSTVVCRHLHHFITFLLCLKHWTCSNMRHVMWMLYFISLSLSLSLYLSIYLSLSVSLSLSLSLSYSFSLSLSLSISLSLSLLSSLPLTPCFSHLLQLPTPPFSFSLSLSILPPTLYISIFHSLHKYSLFLC